MNDKEATPERSITGQWKDRARAVETVTLPSGLIVKMKKPSWMASLKMGVLPTRLFNIAMGLEKADVKKSDGTDNFIETIAIMQSYAIACCVEPHFVMEKTKDDEVSVMDIEDDDLLVIFQKGQSLQLSGKEGEGKALENFHQGSDGSVPRPDSEKIQPEAVSAVGSN